MTAGFLVVFGLLGIVLDGFISSIESWLPWVTIVLGLGLLPFGVMLLRGRSLNLRLPLPTRGAQDRQLLSVFLFGVSYALVSLSCTIPLFIAVVSTTFTSANFVSGMATFVAYALGMGVVLIALTVALALARQSLVRSMRRVLPYVYQVSGVLLLVAGVYVAYYGWYELRVAHGDTSGGGAGRLGLQPERHHQHLDPAHRTGAHRHRAGRRHRGGRRHRRWAGASARPEPRCSPSCWPTPGCARSSTLRSRFGFMAFHGGSLEKGTDDIAAAAAERCGASLYAVIQPPDLRWHLPVGRDRPGRLARAGRLPGPRRGGGGRARLRTARTASPPSCWAAPAGSWPGPCPARCAPPCPTTRWSTSWTTSPASCGACTPTTR